MKEMGAFALRLCAFALVLGIARADGPQWLNSLCEDKQIGLRRVSELGVLISAARATTETEACTDGIRATLAELMPLVVALETDACTMRTVEHLRDFHVKYLVDVASAVKLPEELRDFVKAIGFQLNRKCMQSLSLHLESDVSQLLNESDNQLLKEWTDESKSAVDKLLDKFGNRDLIAVLGDISQTLDVNAQNDDKIAVHLHAGPKLATMQQACEHRFRPIYKHLVLPVAVLTSLGYVNKKDEVESVISKNKLIQSWMRVTYLCESVRDIVVLPVIGDEQYVEMLHATEASMQLAKCPSQSQVQFEPVVYEDRMSPLDDMVIAAGDKSIRKLVRKLTLKLNGYENIRASSLSELSGYVRNQFIKTKIKIVGHKKSHNISSKEELAETFTRYLQQDPSSATFRIDEWDPADIHRSDNRTIVKLTVGFLVVFSLVMVSFTMAG